MSKYIAQNVLFNDIKDLITALSYDYPISLTGSGIPIFFNKINSAETKFSCSINCNAITIDYSNTTAAARAIASALANIECTETTTFKTLGIMLDVSRGMVMKVDHLKKWFRILALAGYNLVMLYTEDTYQLPDEPFFGRFRGAYSAEEIKELDEYAKKLGIELVGCIQTLGHMEQILRWKTAYHDITDTPLELLAEEEKTYKLIEKMVTFWAENLTSRRIHIGMDETQTLGRGNFLNFHGYKNPFDIFNSHLDRVNEICSKKKLKPLIWSDMYFRFGNPNHLYYDYEKPLDKDVMAKVPKNVSLVYWDYYHSDETIYKNMIARHREHGFDPIVASGHLTWNTLWYNYQYSKNTVPPCIKVCQEENVKELFFALWGDDGAYCCFDSVFYGLMESAELAYKADVSFFNKRFNAICKASFDASQAASKFDYLYYNPAFFIWDDPILCIYFDEMVKRYGENFVDTAKEKCLTFIDSIAKYADETQAGDFNYLILFHQLALKKILFQQELKTYYKSKDLNMLSILAQEKIPELINLTKQFNLQFRQQYLRYSKPFGLDRIQLRNGGQIARLEEAKIRIEEFVNLEIASIPELEQPDTGNINTSSTSYNHIAASSTIRW